MIKAFVCGPYRDSRGPFWIERNIHRARLVSAALIKLGYNVFCPHMNTALFDGLVNDAIFLDCAKEWLQLCDICFIVPSMAELIDYADSSGSLEEVASFNGPVYQINYIYALDESADQFNANIEPMNQAAENLLPELIKHGINAIETKKQESDFLLSIIGRLQKWTMNMHLDNTSREIWNDLKEAGYDSWELAKK